jgi:hypothetical protein
MALNDTRIKQMILTAAEARRHIKVATLGELEEAIKLAKARGRGSVLKILEPELERRQKRGAK